MVRTHLYNTKTKEHLTGGSELIGVWEESEDFFLWVDLDREKSATDKILMEERFGLHPLAVVDALRERHPPKLEKFDDFVFILLRGLTAETEDINFSEIAVAIFVGERWLLTRHAEESPSTDWLWDRIHEEPQRLENGAKQLAARLVGRLVKRYVPIIIALEPRLEVLEEELFANPADDMLEELSNYKSRLTKLRRILTYHDQVVSQLRDDQSLGFTDGFHHQLNDIHEHLDRSQSLAQMYYDISSDLVDSYISLASHRLNRIMQILTIVTVIFVPLTFLAGIYGMNFEHIPELSNRYAYFILLGVMGALVLLQLGLFRKNKWL